VSHAISQQTSRKEPQRLMDVVKEDLTWNRRSFLKGIGLSAFALAGLAPFSRMPLQAWAAAKPSRFVYAWTAFDLLDPHVKYDGNAYFFTLNRNWA
jgi:hypothetical protein